MVRRLSPYCSRIELEQLPAKRDDEQLMYAMGWETANIHLGTAAAVRPIKKFLDAQRGGWLKKSTKAMLDNFLADWKQYRKQGR